MTKVIEADEIGRLEFPEVLMQAIKPHAKYVVEAKSDGTETKIRNNKNAKTN